MTLIINPQPPPPSRGPSENRHYIGIDKPKVQYTKEYYKEPGMFEDSDNMANDPEQAGWDRQDGPKHK